MKVSPERGQALVLTAVVFMGLVLFVMYLIVNALSWYNSTFATRQALTRAAQDGATELIREDTLPLLGVSNQDDPTMPTVNSRHCLDVARARATTLASLARNLASASPLYVKDDGAKLSPTEVVSDTTGVYLVELKVINPSFLNCAQSDEPPTYPPAATYPYVRPYVHLAVRLPMKALFGQFIVHPTYTVDVTSAVNPGGGGF